MINSLNSLAFDLWHQNVYYIKFFEIDFIVTEQLGLKP